MIGIFDSGYGGLTIFKEILKVLPQYDYLYLGDNARAPYGNRSQELIYKFTEQAIDFLFKKGCRLIIIACNTASAEALRKIQQEYLPKHYPDRRVLGVIRPLAEAAAKMSRYGRIGVIGTRGTIESGAYEKELKKLSRPGGLASSARLSLRVSQNAAPLLVPLIEEGWVKKPETRMILKKYLLPLRTKQIDTLILGCTHYQILYQEIQKKIGRRCRVLNSGEIVAQSLVDYLKRHPEIETGLSQTGVLKFYTTDKTRCFDALGTRFFGQSIKAEKIELE